LAYKFFVAREGLQFAEVFLPKVMQRSQQSTFIGITWRPSPAVLIPFHESIRKYRPDPTRSRTRIPDIHQLSRESQKYIVDSVAAAQTPSAGSVQTLTPPPPDEIPQANPDDPGAGTDVVAPQDLLSPQVPSQTGSPPRGPSSASSAAADDDDDDSDLSY
jgi:hypothetical protein